MAWTRSPGPPDRCPVLAGRTRALLSSNARGRDVPASCSGLGNQRAVRGKHQFRLKIPGVATHERGQQELAPNRGGGRAAPDDMSSLLRSGREPSAPLHGELPRGSNPPPRSGEPTSGAKGNTSFACVLTSHEGRQSSVRETHLDQLHLRARGTKTPRSRLAGSTLPYASQF